MHMSFTGSRILWATLAMVLSTSVTHAQRIRLNPVEETRPVTVQPVEAPDYAPAVASRQTDFESVPEDFWVHAGLHDIRMQNDLALMFFGRIDPDVSSSEDPRAFRHGNLVDVTLNPATPENFQIFAPVSGMGIKPVVENDSIEYRTDDDGSATVTVEGHDVRYPFLTVRTVYTMKPDTPGLQATTTMVNTSADEVAEQVAAADYVLWGSMKPFIPGSGWTTRNHTVEDAEFVYAREHDVWMMIAPVSGTFDIVQAGSLTRLQYSSPEAMQPGETRLYSRWILVSDQDAAYLFSKVLEARDPGEYGTVVGRMIEREQAPDGTVIDKAPVLNSDVFISPLKRTDWTVEQQERFLNKPYIIAKTNRRGSFNALLPLGDYSTVPAPRSRFAPIPDRSATIKAGEIAAVDFGTSPSSRLIYRIVDAETGQTMPGKLTLEALRGTPGVELGFPGAVRAGNIVYSSHGAGIIDLPPGTYRVIASRGPEYHIAEERVIIRDISDTEKVFRIRRAFETPGWISADVGVRTDATLQSRTDKPTRVVSAAAEGVEWLVSGDSNTATDLSDAVESLSLGRWIKTSPGYRHSGTKAPFRGDFLLFPLEGCSTGSTVDLTPIRTANSTREILQAMRDVCPEAAILASRAAWPVAGFLTMNGLAPGSTNLPDGDWPRDFDALSVWEGKRQGNFEQDYAIYHRMLNEGLRVTAFGSSASAGTWQNEPGYPRVYIQSSTDNPQDIDPIELARNIKDRKVVVTNGPFVDVKVNGEPMGSMVTDTDGEVELDISVFTPNWSQVTSLSINVNGRFVRRILLNPSQMDLSAGKVFPPADKPENGRLRIQIRQDSILDVTAEGTLELPQDPVNPFRPSNPGLGLWRGQFPLAVSAPIFLDADGDGRITPRSREELERMSDEESEDPRF